MPDPNSLQSIGRYYFDTAKNALSTGSYLVADIASSSWNFVKAATIGDLYELLTSSDKLITHELYQRSKLTGVGIGHIGPYWQNWLPKIVVVSGIERNIRKVTSYGEDDDNPQGVDKAARDLLSKPIREVTGSDDPPYGEESRLRRRILKAHMSEPEALKEIHAFGMAFGRTVLESWRQDQSLQNNIGYYAANMIGKCVLGMPHLSMKDIPVLRDFDALVLKGDYTSKEFIAVKNKFYKLGDKVLSKNVAEIVKSRKVIYHLLHENGKADQLDDPEELKQAMLKTRAGAGLFPTGNLTMLLAGAIMYINQDEEVKRRLREELFAARYENISYQELGSLPYLNCVYLESLRIMSPTPLVPRKTSRTYELTVEGKDKQLRTYSIPPRSYLFAPLRCIDNDPEYWPQPRKFNPSRFEDTNKVKYLNRVSGDYFIPFSAGNRLCPAGTKFVPLVFKMLISLVFANYDLRLDKPVKEIPVETLYTRFSEENFATLHEISPHKVPACVVE